MTRFDSVQGRQDRMKILMIITATLMLCACHAPDNANNTITVDEDLINGTIDDPESLTSIMPTDPCGRKTQVDENGKYYTVNHDGTLSPGVLQGMQSKEDCEKLIRTNNGAQLVRVEVN